MTGLADALLRSPHSQHDRLLRLVGGLLRGGEHDPGGGRIKEALVKLPPPAWIFLAEVEERRQNILRALGHGNNWDNFCENFVETTVNGTIGAVNTTIGVATRKPDTIKTFPPNGTRCYDREAELREKTIGSDQLKPYRKNWSARAITANTAPPWWRSCRTRGKTWSSLLTPGGGSRIGRSTTSSS